MIALLITSLIITLFCTILMVSGALIQYYGLSTLIRSQNQSTGTRTGRDQWADCLHTTLFILGSVLMGLSIGIAISAAFGYLLPLISSHWAYP